MTKKICSCCEDLDACYKDKETGEFMCKGCMEERADEYLESQKNYIKKECFEDLK